MGKVFSGLVGAKLLKLSLRAPPADPTAASSFYHLLYAGGALPLAVRPSALRSRRDLAENAPSLPRLG